VTMLSNPKKQPKRDMYQEARRAVAATRHFLQDARFAMADAEPGDGPERQKLVLAFILSAVRMATRAEAIAETLLNTRRNTDEQVVDLAKILDDADELRDDALDLDANTLAEATWPDGGASTNPTRSSKRRLMR